MCCGRILSSGELQITLFSVASLMNERPIGVKLGFSLELGNYLCPNNLLFGLSIVKCSVEYMTLMIITSRVCFIQKIVD